MKSKNAGLYIHIPFCRSKCPYCDFYSLRLDESAANAYTDALIRRIPDLAAKYNITADTVYIGGGTPSALGAERLSRIIGAAGSFLLQNARQLLKSIRLTRRKRILISLYSEKRESTGYPWACSRQTTANAARSADSAAGTMFRSP